MVVGVGCSWNMSVNYYISGKGGGSGIPVRRLDVVAVPDKSKLIQFHDKRPENLQMFNA